MCFYRLVSLMNHGTGIVTKWGFGTNKVVTMYSGLYDPDYAKV